MRVYLDTAVVVYLVENVAPFEAAVREYLKPSNVIPQASLLTRLECRVLPLREGNDALLGDYEDFFASLESGLLPLDTEVFDRAAELRARDNFRTPDALHLAAAIAGKCDVFLTNDRQLTRCSAIEVTTLTV